MKTSTSTPPGLLTHSTPLILGYGLAGHIISALLSHKRIKHTVVTAGAPEKIHKHYPSTAFIQQKSLHTLSKISKTLGIAQPRTLPINTFVYATYIPRLTKDKLKQNRRPISFSTTGPIAFANNLGYMLDIEAFLASLHEFAASKTYQKLILEPVTKVILQANRRAKTTNKTLHKTPHLQHLSPNHARPMQWTAYTPKNSYSGYPLVVATGPKPLKLFSDRVKNMLGANATHAQSTPTVNYMQGVEYLVPVPTNTYEKLSHTIYFIASNVFPGYGAWIAPSVHPTTLKIGFALYQEAFIQTGITTLKKHLARIVAKVLGTASNKASNKIRKIRFTSPIAKLIPIALKPTKRLLEPPGLAMFVGDAGLHVGNLLLDGIYPTAHMSWVISHAIASMHTTGVADTANKGTNLPNDKTKKNSSQNIAATHFLLDQVYTKMSLYTTKFTTLRRLFDFFTQNPSVFKAFHKLSVLAFPPAIKLLMRIKQSQRP